MTKVYVCGDTHIPIDISKLNTTNWPQQKNLCKDDILLILGDFGLLWNSSWTKEEKFWARWLSKKRYTVCFLDGNHENHFRLASLKETNFYGGKAGIAYDNIYHLKRGEIYTFGERSIFVMGGAKSTDISFRTPFKSWWPTEQPSRLEEIHAATNLKKHNYEVDYICTHTCPESVVKYFESYGCNIPDSTRVFFDWIKDNVQFKTWFFGHFHTHKMYQDKFVCLYNERPMRII